MAIATDARQPSRLRSALARIAGAVATPLVPSDYLDLFAPLRTGADLRARVLQVQPRTAESVTVSLQAGRSWRPHRPGQYVRIGIDIDGVRHWRPYSVTSPAAGAPGVLSITVKAIPGGVVSNHIVGELRPGTLVHLDQATGDFTMPAPAPAKTLFVTAGSGITPVFGMLVNHLDALSDVVVLHCAPTEASMIYGPQLTDWARQGRLRLLPRYTDVEGILAPADLDALVPDWRERTGWACGPTAMLDAFEQHWSHHGAGTPLFTERFRPRILGGGVGGPVRFTAQDVSIEADGGRPLLDEGEAAGVLMPSGCRMGICFGCVVPLSEGAVRDLRDGQLTVAEPGDDVMIQTCVSAAAGACSIDL